MSEKKKHKSAAATVRRPQLDKKPAPQASVPPKLRPLFGRPSAASPSQRKRRSSARHSEPAGSVTAKKLADKEGELMLYGTIGSDFWGDGISAKQFDQSLKDLGEVDTIRLRINSGGGDVFDATAMYNMLVNHDAKIIVLVEGVAASAATLISMAGDEIHIAENAQWMIHQASGVAFGNAAELRQYLKLLDNADQLIRLTYSKRTGIDDSELVDMMSFNNWMTAQEAKDFGFVDSIDEAKSVKPHVTEDDPEDTSDRPGVITQERLAAMADNLLSLAASTGYRVAATAKTGAGPVPKESDMNELLRARCVAAGMLATLDDAAAMAWFNANAAKVLTTATDGLLTATLESTNEGGLTAEAILDLMDQRDARIEAKRKTWRDEVDANLSLADMNTPELREACYALQADGITAVRTKIIDAKAKAAEQSPNGGGTMVRFTDNQPSDRHKAAIKSGIMMRCLTNGKRTSEQIEAALPAKDRAEGYQDFAGMPLVKIAEETLYADGWRHETVRRMNPSQIAQCALGFGRNIGIRNESAIHTTGSLTEITRDAVNKTMTTAFTETPATWRQVFRQAASVADFKTKHVIKLSGAGNVPIWPDNTKPEQAKLSNERESYAVEARAQTITFSWRLIINDDLDALSRRPQIEGNAFARTVNAVAWQPITSNAALQSDSVALFSAATGSRLKANLATGSATPTTDTITALRKLMRLQVGLNTPEGNAADDILNIIGRFLVGPAALEGTILKLVRSIADPASGGNSAVYNLAGNLEPCIEPLLDAVSATAFYLFADPSTIDTVEVTFLQGQETPLTHDYMDNETMAQCFTMIQSFASKAIDFRGMAKHNGV